MKVNKHVENILWDIVRDHGAHDGWIFVIIGKGGPTGKTWLTNQLRLRGYKALELTDALLGVVSYEGNINRIYEDWTNKTMTIILNRPIKEEKKTVKMTISEIERIVGATVEIVSEK
jgi:hypothetical protein